jgi:hypothetical protein
VDDIREVLAAGEEAEDLAVMVEELLLRFDLAAAKGLLKEISHLRVVLSGRLPLRHLEVVAGRGLASS